MHSCCHSKPIIYVWLWMVFRRFVETFTPIQSKTSLFCRTILYVTALASQIILESNVRQWPPKEEKWRENSQRPLIFNCFSLKSLWYSILKAWKTASWLSASCRNCTGKIGLWWLCLQIVFLVRLPRPNVPDKCSTRMANKRGCLSHKN